MLLQGRVAIVTGAASGIGAASAQLFADHGARVLAVDLSIDALRAAHLGRDSIAPLEQNITAPDAGERIVAAALALSGTLDILMNNAGVSGETSAAGPYRRYRTADMPDAFWDEVLDVNLSAQFRLTRAALPALRGSPAGRVIGVGSVLAHASESGLAAYSTSKAALAAFLRTVAVEEGKYGTTANWIEPGAIRTAMTRDRYDQPDVRAVAEARCALRRMGEAEDIARAALFLASDLSGFMTGQALPIDGGVLIKL